MNYLAAVTYHGGAYDEARVLAEDNPSQAYALASLVAQYPAVTQESKHRAVTLQTHLISAGFAPASVALPDQNTDLALVAAWATQSSNEFDA